MRAREQGIDVATAQEVVLEERFNGPPGSANGGYACGVLAQLVGGAAEVSLRSPPPLGRPLRIDRTGAGAITASDGDVLVAEARAREVDVEPPPPVSFEQAGEASLGSPFRDAERHPYPTCFACGPARPEGDGLRLFAWWVAGRDVCAAPWVPDRSLAGEDGLVRPEIVWSALDCPSSAPVTWEGDGGPFVLARMIGRLDAPVRAGEKHVALAWPVEIDGRKRHAGSAILTADGVVCGRTHALWIGLAGR